MPSGSGRALAIVKTPAGFEAAWQRGETRSLQIDIRPASIGGVSLFHLPFPPHYGGLRRSLSIARAFLRGLQPTR